MILLFALYANVAWLGIITVITMSIGMGVVISASAYLAYAGRKGVFGYLKTKERLIGLVSDVLELVSYLLLLGFSLYMAWPMLEGIML